MYTYRTGRGEAASSVTISLWEPTVGPYMTKLFAQFSKTHPGLSVSVLVYPGLGDNDSSGKLRAAVLGHSSPDLVDAAVPGASFIQLLQPLNSYLSTIGVNASDMVPAAWSYGQWYGKQYGIAHSWDPDTLLYWNKSLFKAAGLNPNVGPATWAELHGRFGQDRQDRRQRQDRNSGVHSLGWLDQ